MDPGVHPQLTNALQHIVNVCYGYGDHCMWVWCLNHWTMMLLGVLQQKPWISADSQKMCNGMRWILVSIHSLQMLSNTLIVFVMDMGWGPFDVGLVP